MIFNNKLINLVIVILLSGIIPLIFLSKKNNFRYKNYINYEN